jgi:exodeoxyribonuclease VII large subunit
VPPGAANEAHARVDRRVYHRTMSTTDAITEAVYTPSELNREVRIHLEAGFPRVLVEGELSNLSRPASGHLYFSLKDDRAQLRCALFRSAAVRLDPALAARLANGVQVLARGRISLYEPRGDFQLIIDSLQDAGEGALQRQFEELRRKLDAEGLFDAARKRPLPRYPQRIGVVTSPRGAALRDILHVLERRWPLARVRLYPVLVQGADAPAQLQAAIAAASRHGWAELLITGRGGGSLEDLAAFNDETVARTIAASAIPVIAAVGHETDFSIADFVADLRAPTPSAAAELATPDQVVLRESFSRAQRQLLRRAREILQRDAQRLDHLAHRLQQRHPSVQLSEQARRLQAGALGLSRGMRQILRDRRLRAEQLDRRLAAQRPQRRFAQYGERIGTARRLLDRLLRDDLRRRRQELHDLARTLHAVSPLAVMGRGYAVLTAPASGRVVASVLETAVGETLLAQLADGQLDCRVEALREASADHDDPERHSRTR